MYYKKLTRSARIWLREQRQEIQIIRARAKEKISFKYIIGPTTESKIAFGTTLHRETLLKDINNLSPFMRKPIAENRNYPAPWEYSPIIPKQNKYISRKGLSAFANTVAQISINDKSLIPSVGEYNIEFIKPISQSAKPFSVGAKRSKNVKFCSPGPGTYSVQKIFQKQIPCEKFGNARYHEPVIKTICTPKNNSKCSRCLQTDLDEYFHNFSNNLDLCYFCLTKSQKRLTKSKNYFLHRRINRELEDYVPVRYCQFFHNHNGTTAAIQTMSKSLLRRKIKTENYLQSFVENISN